MYAMFLSIELTSHRLSNVFFEESFIIVKINIYVYKRVLLEATYEGVF